MISRAMRSRTFHRERRDIRRIRQTAGQLSRETPRNVADYRLSHFHLANVRNFYHVPFHGRSADPFALLTATLMRDDWLLARFLLIQSKQRCDTRVFDSEN